MNLLTDKISVNMYKGIELDLGEIKELTTNQENIQKFSYILDQSIENWIKNSARSITVRVPSNLSNYIQAFVNRGFYFHHTSGDTLVLCRWLDNTTKNKIPNFAHHHVGIGAILINENLEFLLIKEKFSALKNKKFLWKFVTGLIEGGETIIEGTRREVKEEVDLDVDFHGTLMISESYPNFQKISDLCFFNLCSIKGKDIDYQNLNIDKEELSEAKIFKIDQVKELIKSGEVTLFTEQTFNKLLTHLDFSKNLEDNIANFKENSILKCTDMEAVMRNSNKFSSFKRVNIFH